MELARDASARGSQEVWCCNQGMTCLLPQVEEIDRTVNSVNMYSFFWFQSGGDVLMLCVFNHMLFMDDLTLPGCSQQSGTSSNEVMLESCRVGQLPPPWCIVGCGPKWSPNCLVSKLWYRLIRHIKFYNCITAWEPTGLPSHGSILDDLGNLFMGKMKKSQPISYLHCAPTARKKGGHKRSPSLLLQTLGRRDKQKGQISGWADWLHCYILPFTWLLPGCANMLHCFCLSILDIWFRLAASRKW